ncbi:MAG TPA: hypothetical protein VN081_01095 [Dongiaceae bacterium]|nr:hypothetical protein [Dongiaceae bacterium]
MKKLVTIIFLSLSAILILDSMNVGQAVAMFLLAGVIPGTNIALSGTIMLEVFALLIGFTLARIANTLVSLVRVNRHNALRPQL